MSSYDMTEANRRMGNMVSFGTVESVDYAKAMARIRIGDVVTGDLPMMAPRAGGNQTWAPFEVGEQVCVLAPSGNLSTGVIAGALYSDQGAANGDRAGLHRTTYSNGAVIEFDRDSNTFRMNLSGGHVEITAAGGLTIIGNVTVQGDVIADGISLKNHLHGGVVPGGGKTSKPQ